ncbi:Rhodanese-like protein [Penicillium nucicola]|uniref:Rhodanese-like protein n=1 Tax=Penicillium nucicola TaxID=1850975 RepID=UPI0025452163|nr:Rhodanese-like protein [Penicillium nucicola]KAJ5747303.1 Rhodanese-like protein [Penicillium nucicola]
MQSTTKFPSLLISPNELHHALSNDTHDARVIPVAAGRESALSLFESKHIPGSVFFDMDSIKDKESEYLMMLPTSTQFAEYMTKLNIRPDDVLVIYDAFETGLYSSPRVAWMCRHFGHQEVYVLNNFPRYVEQGFSCSTGTLSTSISTPRAKYPEQRVLHPDNVIYFNEMRDLIDLSGERENIQILDSRPSSQFSGTAAIEGTVLPVGHVPFAINVPLSSILGPDKRILPPVEMKAVLFDAGVKDGMPAVLYCNSGVTAAALDLALCISGLRVETRLYDGSWSEWVKRADKQGMTVTN